MGGVRGWEGLEGRRGSEVENVHMCMTLKEKDLLCN